MAHIMKNGDEVNTNANPAAGPLQGGDPAGRGPGRGVTGAISKLARLHLARRVRLLIILLLSFVLMLAVSEMYIHQNSVLSGQASLVSWWQQQLMGARAAPGRSRVTAVVADSSQDTPTPSAGPATPPHVSGSEVTLADGLRYIDVQVGTGREVTASSSVNVEYTVWLQSNGQKVDSTYDRQGAPYSVKVGAGQVIKGADEGLVGMREGGTRRLIVPPELAFGAGGYPPFIPPNETLIFDVTVVHVG